jgi:hypothetical protein
MLTPVSSINNRAAVTVYGLGRISQTVQVWFFNHPYPVFNTLTDQFFTVGSTATSNVTLNQVPATVEPVSEQVIVEKITSNARYRLLPPWVSYYKVRNGVMTYDIDPKNSVNKPSGVNYALDNVKVYINGLEMRPGYDFTVNGLTEEVTLIKPGIVDGDAIAITPMVDYDYFVTGNNVSFTTPITSATIKVTTFTDHDNMMLRTERFDGKYRRQFVLTYPVISDNYVWVTVDSKPLTAGYDYKVLPDLKTVELSEFVDVGENTDIVIMVVNPPSYGSTLLGYRMFKDMFGKHHFTRLSQYFTTKLEQPLQYSDDRIIVEDGDHLLQPNPGLNIPGVVFIDGERIEYTAKDGYVLSGLRRSTLGTGPALFSDIDTKVIDQSARQTIPTVDYSLIQHFPSSNTTTYTISTVTNSSTFSMSTTTYAGSGIKFSTLTNAVDQIEVYYGGRQLRKSSLRVHDKNVSYYDTAESRITLEPEFIITGTNRLVLNIAEEITTGTRITVVKREARFWTNTTSTSLLLSTGTQATFLRNRPAELPDIYFYGGEKVLLENSIALTDENGEPLEGY